MTTCSYTLSLDTPPPDGGERRVTIESGLPGRVRIVVSEEIEGATGKTFQDADLTPEECRTLAKLLESSADIADADPSLPDDEFSDEESLSSLVEWLESEFGFGAKLVAVMPSSVEVEPYGETYWVIFESPTGRTINWVVGLKYYPEESGPAALDCPAYFFELVPVKNQRWRSKCIKAQKR